MKHWAVDYIGKPWVKDAEGPDSFNCWSMVRFIYREQLGVDLPVVDVDALNLLAVARAFRDSEAYGDWAKVDQPQDFDGVAMSHAKDPHHVGIWLDVDGGGVLHCVQGVGVMFSTPTNLQLSGWKVKGYWRHACRQ